MLEPISPFHLLILPLFTATNPVKRKKLVSPWVLLYWVSKRERSGAIKTTLLSLLLIVSPSQTQHTGILSPCFVTTYLRDAWILKFTIFSHVLLLQCLSIEDGLLDFTVLDPLLQQASILDP